MKRKCCNCGTEVKGGGFIVLASGNTKDVSITLSMAGDCEDGKKELLCGKACAIDWVGNALDVLIGIKPVFPREQMEAVPEGKAA